MRGVLVEQKGWAEHGALWLVAALLLIAIAGGLVLFPEARNAIADRLGLQGVLIRWVDEVPTPRAVPGRSAAATWPSGQPRRSSGGRGLPGSRPNRRRLQRAA